MSSDPNREEASGPVPIASLQVGSILASRYRILNHLGDGAMGSVYLAEHIKIGRKDAIKVLRDSLASDTEAMARFVRGARGVSRIQHENVCAIYDFSDTAEGVQFLAMEYIPGSTLRELLTQEGALPLERVLSISVQVANALQAAHDAGIVHRDLKPANVMLMTRRDGSDLVKVVDFDIAKAEDDPSETEVTRFGFVVGTPEYMSPEQLTGEPLDGRSDVYSLALVVYRMLTGMLPFRVENTREMLVSRLTQTPRPLAEVLPGRSFPPGLQAVLDHALQRSAADRTPSAAAFARAISAALADVVTAAPTLPPRTEIPATRVANATTRKPEVGYGPPRQGRNLRGVGLGVAVALAVSATALGAWALRNRGEGGVVAPDSAAGSAAAQNAGGQQTAAESTQVISGPQQFPDPPANERPRPNTSQPQTDGSRATEGASDGSARPAPALETPLLQDLDGKLLRWRQAVFRLSTNPDAIDRGTLRAMRDSAQLVWNQSTEPEQRMRAAFLIGSVLYHLGDHGEGRVWAQRSLDLCTTNCRAYEVLLQSFPSR